MAAVALLALGLVSRQAGGQGHQHDAATGDDDPEMRVMLAGPHLVLAHRGYLGLSDPQVEGLLRARKALCSAEVTYHEAQGATRRELGALLTGDAQPRPLTAALEQAARVRATWLLALVRARREASAQLNERQRALVVQLTDHWLRESNAMIAAATHVGQVAHPGMQLPIRVPGMMVSATALVPFCEVLHGPARHISIPPP